MDKEDYLPLPAVNGFHKQSDNEKSHKYFFLADYHPFCPELPSFLRIALV